jgi:HrpA-like RNA helicase
MAGEISKDEIARKVESELRAALLRRVAATSKHEDSPETDHDHRSRSKHSASRSTSGHDAGSRQESREKQDAPKETRGSSSDDSIRWDLFRSQEGQEELDRILFSRDDYFRIGSNLQQEFNDFFEKYMTFRKKELSKSKPIKHESHIDDHGCKDQKSHLTKKQIQALEGLPSRYDPRYRFNFTILTPHVPVADTSSSSRSSKSIFRPEELSEARRALVMFEDFRQRRSIKKIAKLREDQRALPIFAFKEQIIAAVRNNPVVLIAGDTGCGKSTQVLKTSAPISRTESDAISRAPQGFAR